MITKNIALIGASTAIVGGGVAGGIYFVNSGDAIDVTLSKEVKLLSSNSADLWNLKLNTYNTERKSTNPIVLNKDDWTGLKSWCANTLNKKFSTKNKEYENAKALCSVPSNKEKLKKLGKTLTGITWSEKESTYKSSDNNLIPTIEKTKATAKQIEDWCNVATNEEYKAENEGNYSLTLKWCTKEGV